MQEKPLVSWIVAVYNTELYLEQCLRSIVEQTYPHWELLVVDDGSSDRSLDISRRFEEQDARIRVIARPHSGKPDCCNEAIAQAKGQFVGFIDSDDWIEPDTTQVLLDAIRETGKDCASCGYMNEFVGETVYDPVCEEQQVLSRSEAVAMIYNRRLYGYLHGRLYRRELLVEPIPQLPRYEDFAVIYKWLSHGNGLTLCPRFLYHYRQRMSSIMNSDNDHMFGFIPLLEGCYHYVEYNQLLPEQQNKSLVVRNCMRIAKDIARRTRGPETFERLKMIRRVIRRMQPASREIVGTKRYWRMHLLLVSIPAFEFVMRLRHLFIKGNRKSKKEFYE